VNSDFSLGFLPGDVHLENGPAQRYLTSNKTHVYTSHLSLATFRNPYDRFESFWFEKVVFLSDINYREYSLGLLTDEEAKSIEGIREAAKRFLKSLDFLKPDTLDRHLRPQSYTLESPNRYDVIVETQKLKLIPSLISTASDRYSFTKNLDFPVYNSGPGKISGDFFDADLRELINEFYESDFEILKEFGDVSLEKSPNLGEYIEVSQLQGIRANSEKNSLILEKDALRYQNAKLNEQILILQEQVLLLRAKIDAIQSAKA
jgi:hypothetical protein